MRDLLHPTTHGNPLSFDDARLTVLPADALTAGVEAEGLDRCSDALTIKPVEFVELDMTMGTVIGRSPAAEGSWAGIPVPTF